MGLEKALPWLIGRAIASAEKILLIRLFTPVTTCGHCDCDCPPLPDFERLHDACQKQAGPQPGEAVVSIRFILSLVVTVGAGGVLLGALLTGCTLRLFGAPPRPLEAKPGRVGLQGLSPTASESSLLSGASRGPTSPSGRWPSQQQALLQ